MRRKEYEQNVFINCPFDSEYAPIFEAIVFAVNDAGFRPKCARERLDSSQVRLQKIVTLISASRFSIHDLSRTDLDDVNALPRFNMPLELGIDLVQSALFRQVTAHLRFGAVPIPEVRFGSQRPGHSPTRRQSEDRGEPGSKLASYRIGKK
jgi:hypothetical protein